MRSRARVVAALTVLFASLFGLQAGARADTFSGAGFATETIATVPPYTLVRRSPPTSACSCGRRTASCG